MVRAWKITAQPAKHLWFAWIAKKLNCASIIRWRFNRGLIVEIQEHKEVWIAWTNTDCTEGRGRQIPKYVCDSEATAIRLGRKGYVQGSNCPVTKGIAVRINNCWLVPGIIELVNRDDIAAQKRIDEKRAAIEKAKSAGLTDDDLKLISAC